MGLLRNHRHELYCQNVVAGMTRLDAYKAAGYEGQPERGSTLLSTKPEVQARIKELLTSSAARSELTRKEILDRVFQDWELARKLGQTASALKAAELMGREMHKMFTERKEIGGPGDFDNKSEDELKEIIQKELGDLGWDNPTTTH